MVRPLLTVLTWLLLTSPVALAADFRCVNETTVGSRAHSETLPDGSRRSTVTTDTLNDVLGHLAEPLEAARSPIDVTALRDIQNAFFRQAGNTRCTDLYMVGRIVPGDFEKFRRMVARPNMVARLWLASSGGDVAEAIRIGELVRELFIETHAPTWSVFDIRTRQMRDGVSVLSSDALRTGNLCNGARCICASACVLIWAAGADRNGDVIGLHRPSFNEQVFGQITAAEAQRVYAQVIDSVDGYYRRMELPSRTISAFLGTDSQRLVVPPRDYPNLLAPAWGEGRPPSIDEWSRMHCPRTPKWHTQAEMMSDIRSGRSGLPSSAESACQVRLFSAERARRYARYWNR